MIVVENIIPLQFQEELKKVFLDNNFPWYFAPNSAYEDETIENKYPNQKQVPGFYHVFVDNKEQNSGYWDIVKPLIYFIVDKTDYKINEVLRVKANMLLPNRDYTNKNFNGPHCDFPNQKHNVALYYVNDSDGDTFMFNETLDKQGNKPESITIQKQISPKQGSVLLFDGKYLHASSSPINSKYRININIDFI